MPEETTDPDIKKVALLEQYPPPPPREKMGTAEYKLKAKAIDADTDIKKAELQARREERADAKDAKAMEGANRTQMMLIGANVAQFITIVVLVALYMGQSVDVAVDATGVKLKTEAPASQND